MTNTRSDDSDRNNQFYRARFQTVVMASLAAIVVIMALVVLLLYQVSSRPLPTFTAVAPNKQALKLTSSYEPNLLPDTLIKWASKAAVAAYTFDFVNYKKQIEAVRPYFTEDGWSQYQSSVQGLISTIADNKLFVNSVVSGPPVISNQGDLTGRGYAWRVQLPFLVTYQSAQSTTHKNFMVLITIIRIPTTTNPKGIGIDQFVMM